MHTLLTDFPSSSSILLSILAVDVVVVLRVVCLVWACLAGVPGGDIISTVAAHVPIVVILGSVGIRCVLLLLLSILSSWHCWWGWNYACAVGGWYGWYGCWAA